MKTRRIVVAVAVASGVFVTGAVAQHEEHQKGQVAPPVDKTDTGKVGSMMAGNMMSQMRMGQNESGKLVDQLVKSFAAIEIEKDPAALKERLAEHGRLLQALQTKLQTQSRMMDMMRQMMGVDTKK